MTIPASPRPSAGRNRCPAEFVEPARAAGGPRLRADAPGACPTTAVRRARAAAGASRESAAHSPAGPCLRRREGQSPSGGKRASLSRALAPRCPLAHAGHRPTTTTRSQAASITVTAYASQGSDRAGSCRTGRQGEVAVQRSRTRRSRPCLGRWVPVRRRRSRAARVRRNSHEKGNRRFGDRPGTVESSPCGDGSGEVGSRGGWQSHGAGAAEEGHGPK